MGRKNLFFIVGVIGLTLFGIPLRRSDVKSNIESLFDEYIAKFNKTYKQNETEYTLRMENFKKSLQLIQDLNKNRSNNSSALYGLTIYADMSQEEFKQMMLQTNHSISNMPVVPSVHSSSKQSSVDNSEEWKHKHRFKINSSSNSGRLKRAITKLPPVVDWRKKKVIGAVHNQKTCGACWAFSTIETMEAMNAMKNRTFISLSVQEAIDCARNGNYGCEGGDSCSLLQWLVKTKTRITTETAYPFTHQTHACRMKASVGVQVLNFTCEKFVDEEYLLLEKLAFHGPVAAAVNALNWQYYLGGIIQFHCSGSLQDMNHAVQIVGYNRKGPVPHYIVRNSWGLGFGDYGYLYIAIGGNICGIANEVTSLDVV